VGQQKSELSRAQFQQPHTQSHGHELRIPEFKVHSPCPEVQSSPDYNVSAISEKAQRFQLAPVDTWRLDSLENDNDDNHNHGHYVLHFDLMECPPQYMASTFHVQSSTKQSIFAGTVGPRYKIEEGCGFYSASVPVPDILVSPDEANDNSNVLGCGGDGTAIVSSSHIIAIEAFWTSNFRNYANRMQDVRLAEAIKEKKDI